MKQYPPEGMVPSDSEALRSPQRRRLIHAGLSAAPVVLLATSPTVQAANCKSPSGFSVSGNLSRNAGIGCTDGGVAHTPLFWSTNLTGTGSYKGSGAIFPTTLFSDRFPSLGPYPDASFGTLLSSSNISDQALFAAVFLEAGLASPPVGFPDRNMIKDMWRGVTGSGYAVPNSVVVWDKTAILKYLMYLTGQTTH